jgi:hypothetical protein
VRCFYISLFFCPVFIRIVCWLRCSDAGRLDHARVLTGVCAWNDYSSLFYSYSILLSSQFFVLRAPTFDSSFRGHFHTL